MPKAPKQLCIIKDLFSHGEKHTFFDSKLDKRLAIISFHNSIELFFRYTLNSKAVSSDELDNINFKKKIELFESKLLKGKPVLYRPKILDLNNLRNKIYHNYLEPRKEETEEFRIITNLFLKEYTKTIFGLDFENISSFDLENVRNPFVKDAYIKAMECF